MNIGKAMRQLRKEADIKQNVLAKEIGISASALRALESGKSIPKQSTIDSFCRVLGVPKAFLTLVSIDPGDLVDALDTMDAKDVLDIIGLAQRRIRRSLDRYNGYIDEV
ncbi:MAG: helix-turn-helix transcriptional regulator [Bacteroidales bacterium]|nr:helix-turn-helix transcriptional regulator [Bacteroidales bacterium]